MKKIIIILAVLLTFNCLTKQDSKNIKQENKTLSIKKVETIIDNIDYSYWNDSHKDRSLFYDFFIYYNEPDIKANDIEYCKVYNSHNYSWIIDLNKYFNTDQNYIGGYHDFYDDKFSNNGSVLTIKDLNVIIKLKNNFNLINYDISLNNPNDNLSEYSYIYNEDYKGEINNNYVSAIKRANILNKEKKENKIIIEFTIDDPRVITGEVWFYNKENKHIATSKTMFVNEYSKEISKNINDGKSLNIDGKTNIINLTNEDIKYFENIYRFEDIVYCVIMLNNGLYNNENKSKKNTIYRSISERIIF